MKKLFLISLFPAFLFSCRQQNDNERLSLNYNPHQTELFAEDLISTNLNERDIAITQGGDEIIFTLGAGRLPKRCLVSIKIRGNHAGKKEILSFSGEHDDLEPFFSPDGSRLYFASDRPIEGDTAAGDYNLWVAERTDSGWSKPEALPHNINSGRDEFFPAVGKSGNIYFTSVRDNGIGTEDIFVSRFVDGRYSDPVPLDTAINSVTWEFNAYVSPDEDLIIFSSAGRKDDMGGGDLYFSRKNADGNWQPARNMGAVVNSSSLDYCPFVDWSGKNFYFTSERVGISDKKTERVKEIEELAGGLLNGSGNIYRIGIEALGL